MFDRPGMFFPRFSDLDFFSFFWFFFDFSTQKLSDLKKCLFGALIALFLAKSGDQKNF